MAQWNLKLLSVGEIRPDPNWRLSSHSHTFCEMIVPVAGKMHVTIDGHSLVAEVGEVLLYPAGIAHREQTDRAHPVATRFVSFIWNCPPAGLPYKVADTGERIRQAADWLLADRDLADSPTVRHYRRIVLITMVAGYARSAQRGVTDDQIVAKVRELARQRMADGITLRDLARVAGLSPFHFIRVYRKLCGRSPMADVRAIRLERARELLLTTDLGLKQIAPQCGMGSEYALSRAFSRHFGHPPSQLRRR